MKKGREGERKGRGEKESKRNILEEKGKCGGRKEGRKEGGRGAGREQAHSQPKWRGAGPPWVVGTGFGSPWTPLKVSLCCRSSECWWPGLGEAEGPTSVHTLLKDPEGGVGGSQLVSGRGYCHRWNCLGGRGGGYGCGREWWRGWCPGPLCPVLSSEPRAGNISNEPRCGMGPA